MKDKNVSDEKGYWNHFYEKWVIDVPSQFCVQVATEVGPDETIVEFGCGNGRDALYLVGQGHIVVALDLSVQAIAQCNEKMEQKGISHAEFIRGDLARDEDVKRALDLARRKSGEKSSSSGLAVYSRFVLHTLDDMQETAFLSSLSKQLKKNERVYLEFRSLEDADEQKLYGNHYRRYIDTDRLIDELTTRYGFAVEYSITGQGMAKYKEEDPFISRIIARSGSA